MSPPTLAQPFNQIDLSDLYRSLSKQQIRDLQSLLETTEFRYDIIANLPTELVTLVFQQLDLYQSYQCRRVSRRWQELLSSKQVVKALLHPWTATEDLPLRIPRGSSTHSILDIQAEHQDAFRRGKPFSSVRIPHGRDVSPDMAYLMHDFSDGILSWVETREGCDRVCLYELENSTLSYFMPPERESIDEIRLSAKLLVAVTTSARCYIWAHRTSSLPYSLRLPSRSLNASDLSDSSFVLLQSQGDHTKPLTYGHGEIIIWKLQDSAVGEGVTLRAGVSMFPVRLPSGTSIESWHDIVLDKRQQNIVLMEWMFNKDERIHTFRILHFSISGILLSECSLERPYATDLTWIVHENDSEHNQRFFELWVVTRVSQDRPHGSSDSPQKTTIAHLRYSIDRRVLQLMEENTTSNRHYPLTKDIKVLFAWKGIGYFEEPRWAADDEVSCQLRVMDFHKGTCVDADVGAHRHSDDSTVMINGDEIFLVRLTVSHFVVFCFDKHRPMAGQTILRGHREYPN